MDGFDSLIRSVAGQLYANVIKCWGNKRKENVHF